MASLTFQASGTSSRGRADPKDAADYPRAPSSSISAQRSRVVCRINPGPQALVKERSEQLGQDDPVGFCRPGGALRILTFPPFRKFLQLPELFVILSERDVTYRQMFMDGRPLPDDPDTDVQRLLDRAMGRRHAGCEEQRLSRRHVAGSERQPDE